MSAPAATNPANAASTAAVKTAREARLRRRRTITAIIGVAVGIIALPGVFIGTTVLHPVEVWHAITGDPASGVSFILFELRLPRTLLGLLAGFAFGIAGITFQTMLRNTLASPDIIGVTSGASTAAVFAIVVLGWGETAVSLVAVTAALATAGVILGLSAGTRFSTTRLILIGIGLAAMLDATTTYLLSKAAAWDVQAAMQWLTGSLNGATWQTLAPLALAVGVLAPILLVSSRALGTLNLGENIARGLGLPVQGTRAVLFIAAVAILACATAASGPIAFVAFMSGPIASRLVKSSEPPLFAAGLIGAALVLAGDFFGQHALGTQFPVGIITGVLGAPYLIYLLIKTGRNGGAL
ncbi:MAG: FecCD family ABC transporter permease [Leucobacter sp.]